MSDMKPCPFCGKEPMIEPSMCGPVGMKGSRIVCVNYSGCQAAPHVYGDTLEEAIERWNRRTP